MEAGQRHEERLADGAGEGAHAAPDLLEIVALAPQTDLEVLVGDTVRVRVPVGFDEDALRRVLVALEVGPLIPSMVRIFVCVEPQDMRRSFGDESE